MNTPSLGAEDDQQVLLEEVAVIPESPTVIETRDQIKKLVELPLIAACEVFYDKNIKTTASSANKKDIKAGYVYILIDFDTLSEDNKLIAQGYGQPVQNSGFGNCGKLLSIRIPVDESTPIDEISQKAVDIARSFKKQPAVWIPKRKIESFTATHDQLVRCFLREGPEWADPNYSGWNDLGYDYDQEKGVFYSREEMRDCYYDPVEDVYYRSEEHFKKANERI